MDRDETTQTLLDKATEDDAMSRQLGEIASSVILERLKRLRKVEELLRGRIECCPKCDAALLEQVGEIVGVV